MMSEKRAKLSKKYCKLRQKISKWQKSWMMFHGTTLSESEDIIIIIKLNLMNNFEGYMKDNPRNIEQNKEVDLIQIIKCICQPVWDGATHIESANNSCCILHWKEMI